MKIYIILISALIFFISCNSSNNEEVKIAKSKMVLDTTTYDYGEMEWAAKGVCEFEFTNKGVEPLIITRVRSSCGCTVPTWTKEPIPPQGRGKIEISYNTRIEGAFSKGIRIYTNEGKYHIVRVKGKIGKMPPNR